MAPSKPELQRNTRHNLFQSRGSAPISTNLRVFIMQSVEQELPGLINRLLQAPAVEQRRLIERHFTPECRLTHALVCTNTLFSPFVPHSIKPGALRAARVTGCTSCASTQLESLFLPTSLPLAAGDCREQGGDYPHIPVLAHHQPPSLCKNP